MRYADPSGHCWWCAPLAIGIVIGVSVGLAYDIFVNTPPTKGPAVQPPDRRNLTSWVVNRINQDTTAPITRALKDNLHSSNPINKAGALKAWTGLVQENAAWDYKKDIRASRLTEANTNIKIGDISTNYQAVANMTYGILAAEIGLPQGIAEFGAGAAQLQNNYHPSENIFDFSGVGGVETSFDDPFDNYWIKFGYEFQQNHGSEFGSLTDEILTTSINEYISKNGEPPKPLKPGN